METAASKIVIRPDGTKYDIQIKAIVTGYGDKLEYQMVLLRCESGKRKFHRVGAYERDSFPYRRLNQQEKAKFDKEFFEKHVTPEEILAAKMELWEKLKPTLENDTAYPQL